MDLKISKNRINLDINSVLKECENRIVVKGSTSVNYIISNELSIIFIINDLVLDPFNILESSAKDVAIVYLSITGVPEKEVIIPRRPLDSEMITSELLSKMELPLFYDIFKDELFINNFSEEEFLLKLSDFIDFSESWLIPYVRNGVIQESIGDKVYSGNLYALFSYILGIDKVLVIQETTSKTLVNLYSEKIPASLLNGLPSYDFGGSCYLLCCPPVGFTLFNATDKEDPLDVYALVGITLLTDSIFHNIFPYFVSIDIKDIEVKEVILRTEKIIDITFSITNAYLDKGIKLKTPPFCHPLESDELCLPKELETFSIFFSQPSGIVMGGVRYLDLTKEFNKVSFVYYKPFYSRLKSILPELEELS